MLLGLDQQTSAKSKTSLQFGLDKQNDTGRSPALAKLALMVILNV
jgi:hypothetical protein